MFLVDKVFKSKGGGTYINTSLHIVYQSSLNTSYGTILHKHTVYPMTHVKTHCLLKDRKFTCV